MPVFSERNSISPTKAIQTESVDLTLLNRLWNVFYNREHVSDWDLHITGLGKAELLLDAFGNNYRYPEDRHDVNANINDLREYLLDAPWYEIYDFLERYVSSFADEKKQDDVQFEFNAVLEEEKSGYRLVGGLVVPITNVEELKSLEKAMNTPFQSVNCHFKKAIELYSKRKKPDYENSVKESISAVEAICCSITGLSGSQATLGAAIKKLKDSGVHIHGAMEKAFLALYGYTSDENGIRHGGIDFTTVPAEDAKYMLVSCSAFVNYLIEKWSKAGT